MAEMHWAVEGAAKASDLTWIFLRPNSFMQNFLAFMAGSINTQNVIYILGR